MDSSRVYVRGVSYHVEQYGEGDPLLLLHGFTGSAAVWRPFQAAWPGWRLIAVDLLGHGETEAPRVAERYRMKETVADLLELMEALGHRRFACLGYSMGGRVALALAVNAPERVRALVLESASPGLADATVRAERVRRDEELASYIEEQGVARFVERWEALPLFATQRRCSPEVLARQRSIRLSQRGYGLAASLRGLGTGQQPSYWGELGNLTMPTLLVTGSLDEKYTRLAQAMVESNPRMTWRVVEDAGHTVHLEAPQPFAECVREFLATVSDHPRH
jgi:2-succinyl-6-hydroxy-2,4-cyclohexadiene-1-carboxylate synthase